MYRHPHKVPNMSRRRPVDAFRTIYRPKTSNLKWHKLFFK